MCDVINIQSFTYGAIPAILKMTLNIAGKLLVKLDYQGQIMNEVQQSQNL